MKIAALVSSASFEAEIVDAAGMRGVFENSMAGMRKFERWALAAYQRGSDINVVLWEAESGASLTAFPQAATSGALLFRSWLPWRSANGLVGIDYMAHQSAQRFARRFGYDDVCIAAVVRRAKGEFPPAAPDISP
ncbi:hypothetical protein [Roseateles sp. L2-2]|uniref:hypothetical protein n=1 Tax=Roseateles TaxID=93681 RepID=UPI003D35F37F